MISNFFIDRNNNENCNIWFIGNKSYRILPGSTIVRTRLTFNPNSQNLNLDSVNSAITNNKDKFEGMALTSVESVFINNPATTVSPINSDGNSITSSNILIFIFIFNLISILF